MQDTYRFDGKKHISLDGTTIYLGVQYWVLDRMAEYLWKVHGEGLLWKEVGDEGFVAFLKEGDTYIEGEIFDPLKTKLFIKGKEVDLSEFIGSELEQEAAERLFESTFC
nr:hypothetical protein MarFTME_447 [Marseillevirus futianmevirus]